MISVSDLIQKKGVGFFSNPLFWLWLSVASLAPLLLGILP